MTISHDPSRTAEQIAHATAHEVEIYLESVLPKALDATHEAGIDACRQLDWSANNVAFITTLLHNYNSYRDHHDLNYALGAYDYLISTVQSFTDHLHDYELEDPRFYQLLDYLENHDFRSFKLTEARSLLTPKEN